MSSASSSPADGPLVDRAALLDVLSGALAAPPAPAEIVDGETESAVLVPLYLHDGEIHGVFTERRADMRRHAGEVSFPGGRRDPGDAQLVDTALREACEEIGLPRNAVDVVGELATVRTMVTGYRIHPFVGVIEPGHTWLPSAGEVARVLELSLHDLRAGFAMRPITRHGLTFRTETYIVGDALIWGATARILGELLERVPA